MHDADPDEDGQEEDGVEVGIATFEGVQKRQQTEPGDDPRETEPARPALPRREPIDRRQQGCPQTDKQHPSLVDAGSSGWQQARETHEAAGEVENGRRPPRESARGPRLGLPGGWSHAGADRMVLPLQACSQVRTHNRPSAVMATAACRSYRARVALGQCAAVGVCREGNSQRMTVITTSGPGARLASPAGKAARLAPAPQLSDSISGSHHASGSSSATIIVSMHRTAGLARGPGVLCGAHGVISRKMPRVPASFPSLKRQLMLPSTRIGSPVLETKVASTLLMASPAMTRPMTASQWARQSGWMTSKTVRPATSSRV